MRTSTNLGLSLPDLSDYINAKRDISDNMEIIDDAYGNLNSKLTNIIVAEEKDSGSISQAISGGSDIDYDLNVAKTGYTPIGIVGLRVNGGSNGQLYYSRFYLSGNTAKLAIGNKSSSTVTVTKIIANVLYLKNS